MNFPSVSTNHLIEIYRFLTDYKAVEGLGLTSVASVIAGLFKLPNPPQPALDSRQTPYLHAIRARRSTIFIGTVTVPLTVAMLWVHFKIASEIGKPGDVIKVPLTIRSELRTFFLLFSSILVLHFFFWRRVIRASAKQT